MKQFTIVLLLAMASVLTACGGGGGSGPASDTARFPLSAAYKATVAGGITKSFTVSGSCSGTGSVVESVPTSGATFEGQASLSGTSTSTLTFTNCTPSNLQTSKINYYDSNFVYKGYFDAGSSSYSVVTTPANYAGSVRVGDTGQGVSRTTYTNSAKTTIKATSVETYVIEADTSGASAIVNFITKTYDVANTLQQTEQDRYRISATGALVLVSFDLLTASGTYLLMQ